MAEKPTFWENVISYSALTIFVALVGWGVWAYRHRPKSENLKHPCPYCGQAINVKLEKSVEKESHP